ncbi:YtcA family lipoprotein [Paludibacterium sp.]|uniref:YtcA family lipoprotein n=1 Tax=Paludibacterium sp. TaxID=1917523 RepID=UPI0025CD8A83|nr:YtcA family lipoprotein [Paludibacterium sp.]MBV8646882.1 hypothetical protein [Paludibacterium sp.]
MKAIGVAAVLALLMSGCANAPSINVLGAYFPDWLFCIVAGVLLAIVVYRILQHRQRGTLLGPPVVVYPSLVTLFSLVFWLAIFQH